jgi:hypothetical protein
MQKLNTAPPAVTAGTDDRLARLLVWLGELIQQNGAGEYIVNVAQDGHVTVKRPRKPLEFHYGG